MPRGNYDNRIRKLRYARLRDLGVTRNLAMLIRDWRKVSYERALDRIRRYGVAHVNNVPNA